MPPATPSESDAAGLGPSRVLDSAGEPVGVDPAGLVAARVCAAELQRPRPRGRSRPGARPLPPAARLTTPPAGEVLLRPGDPPDAEPAAAPGCDPARGRRHPTRAPPPARQRPIPTRCRPPVRTPATVHRVGCAGLGSSRSHHLRVPKRTPATGDGLLNEQTAVGRRPPTGGGGPSDQRRGSFTRRPKATENGHGTRRQSIATCPVAASPPTAAAALWRTRLADRAHLESRYAGSG